MPREIPFPALQYEPNWDSLSAAISEVNWRYVSVQAGLGKDVKVGTEAGKSVQACIAVNENPLKGHVTKLQAQEGGVKENNVLPMTLSPRVPAPSVGGLPEGKLTNKGAKRSIKQALSDEDKENDPPDSGTGLRKKKAAIGKMVTRASAQQAFPDIPEERNVGEEPGKPRRMAPPERKPSSNSALQTTTARATATQSVPVVPRGPIIRTTVPKELERKKSDEVVPSGAKRLLRGTKGHDGVERPTMQGEINAPSRAPSQVQSQRSALRRTTAQDNLKQVHASSELSDVSPFSRHCRMFRFGHGPYGLELQSSSMGRVPQSRESQTQKFQLNLIQKNHLPSKRQ